MTSVLSGEPCLCREFDAIVLGRWGDGSRCRTWLSVSNFHQGSPRDRWRYCRGKMGEWGGDMRESRRQLPSPRRSLKLLVAMRRGEDDPRTFQDSLAIEGVVDAGGGLARRPPVAVNLSHCVSAISISFSCVSECFRSYNAIAYDLLSSLPLLLFLATDITIH